MGAPRPHPLMPGAPQCDSREAQTWPWQNCSEQKPRAAAELEKLLCPRSRRHEVKARWRGPPCLSQARASIDCIGTEDRSCKDVCDCCALKINSLYFNIEKDERHCFPSDFSVQLHRGRRLDPPLAVALTPWPHRR